MKRSKWKGPSICPGFIKNALGKKKYQFIKISRNSEITPNLIGLKFKVHNGKKYSEINATKEMIGHKFGEFSFTRNNFVFKKKKNK
jgi:ribosomal protein S19